MNIIKTISYPFNLIDPQKEDNKHLEHIPAFRAENYTNIYTSSYNLKSKNNQTGTNPWGMEAAVNSKGIVIDINDRVSIPKNGFVISGNSKGEKFIKDNIKIGSRISLDFENKIIHVETNRLNCLFLTLEKKEKSIKNRYAKAIKNAYRINIKEIDSLFAKYYVSKRYIKKYLILENIDKKQLSKYNSLIKKSSVILDNIYLLTSPSFKICSRNVWMRPHEQSLNEIKNTLKLCKKLNINGLYVESFYNGDIPGISKITDTNKEVVNGFYDEYGNDYLKALISEAHKLNIEVHAWVECFFVGEQSKHWKQTYKDSWHMVNYDGSTVQGNNDEQNEKDFIWLDPANPECLSYVLSIYRELLSNYDFDGINVDYVRYPHGNLSKYSSNGYTQYAIEEFKNKYNLKGNIKELIEDPIIYQQWVSYRVDKITLLMSEVRKLVDEIKPNCYISTAVCSDLNYAIQNKMQNWKVWARKGWLDLTLPMAYYIGTSEIAVATKELVNFNKDNAFSYTGIMCMMKDLPKDLVVKQINTLLENHADGYALFHLGDLIERKDCRQALIKSVNRYSSIHPHSQPKKLIDMFIKELKLRRPFFKSDIDNTIHELMLIRNYELTHLINSLNNIYIKETNKVLKKDINKIIHYLKIQKQIAKKHRYTF